MPHCRRIKTLCALGYYVRNLSRLGAGALQLSVRRFRCCVCRKTVSLLPAFAQPYRFVQNHTIEYFVRGGPFSDTQWEALMSAIQAGSLGKH